MPFTGKYFRLQVKLIIILSVSEKLVIRGKTRRKFSLEKMAIDRFSSDNIQSSNNY